MSDMLAGIKQGSLKSFGLDPRDEQMLRRFVDQGYEVIIVDNDVDWVGRVVDEQPKKRRTPQKKGKRKKRGKRVRGR